MFHYVCLMGCNLMNADFWHVISNSGLKSKLDELFVNKKAKECIQFLQQIPEMKSILSGIKRMPFVLPAHLVGAKAKYFLLVNKIAIDPKVIKLDDPSDKVRFISVFAHELCHANQKQNGLMPENLKSASFSETVRIYKMMELEARLNEAIVVHKLLNMKEFAGAKPTSDCRFYEALLNRANGDEKKAKSDFVKAFWKADRKFLSEDFGNASLIWNYCYNILAYHDSLLRVGPKAPMKLSGNKTAEEIMKMYIERMSVTGVSASEFLDNSLDIVKIDDNKREMRYPNGDAYSPKGRSSALFEASCTDDNGKKQSFLISKLTGATIPVGELDYGKDNKLYNRLVDVADFYFSVSSEIAKFEVAMAMPRIVRKSKII